MGDVLANDRRVRVRVTGTVQGVGFRPYVYRLATGLHLDGWVANGIDGVLIEVAGTDVRVDRFLLELARSPPPLARIVDITVVDLAMDPAFETRPPGRTPAFRIVASQRGSGASALMPSDAATCQDCLRELDDSTNRRFAHPFIVCTNCGPRYSIARSVPYDRSATTMAAFPMCTACEAEYCDPADRRYHAEPICCADCGPRLRYVEANDESGLQVTGDDAALAATVDALRSGRIVAIKGIGGYHLAVDGHDDAAVRRLRERKHRDEKPFALLVADIATASRIVAVSDAAVALLCGVEAPIVLLPRADAKADIDVAGGVAPGNAFLAVMLPSSGLQHLLARAFARPLVMTSGNRHDEPVATDDADAILRLSDIADAFLLHDRAIHRRVDDSLVRLDGDRPAVLRRARGYAPRSVPLSTIGVGTAAVLGVGAELKSTICLARDGEAVLSAHLGDLEHLEVYRSFTAAIGDLESILGVRPELIVHDLHPEYLSTKWALEQDEPLLGVQHHHAHIASCLAEHGLTESVVGLAFDGHGYGPDGTLWGGECLIADLHRYERIGHLDTIALPGGMTAIREPWRMAAAYLLRAYEGNVPRTTDVVTRNAGRWSDVEVVVAHSSTIQTSSIGRLFDAVAAIIGIRDRSSFEGQAAIELEQAARRAPIRGSSPRCTPIAITESNGVFRLDPTEFVRWLAEARRRGDDVHELAWLAHRSIADASVRLAVAACERSGLATVALSGGVFQNALLTEFVRTDLESRGVRVLTHAVVPPNDGGISLGQVAIGHATLNPSVSP